MVEEDYEKAYKNEMEREKKALEAVKEEGHGKAESEKKKEIKRHKKALEAIEEFTSDILISNDGVNTMDDVEMAVATFLTYYMSRDGMGKDYSETKSNSLEKYYRQLVKLEDVAERFRDVTVIQADALHLVAEYGQAKNVMLYLDPSYLSEGEGRKGKKDKKAEGRKDLGKGVYNRSFDYEKHEELALLVRDAKAHIILSNYDAEPYKSELTEEAGWKRMEFETTTGVGGKKGNLRTEVLWYNY